jgi:hypothetical protein
VGDARPPAPFERSPALDQLGLAHHAQDALAVDGSAELLPRHGGHHPIPAGLVRGGKRDDRLLDRIGDRTPLGRPTPRRRSVERLPADRARATAEGE